VCGAELLLLSDVSDRHVPVVAVPEVGLDALALVSDDEHDLLDARITHSLDDVLQKRPVRDRNHRLQPPVRQRTQPSAGARGEHDGGRRSVFRYVR